MTAMTSAVARPDGELPIHLWLPPAGSGPGLLLLQEIFGVSGYIRQRAQDLADLGYVVMAPELYWRVDGEIDDTADDALDQGMALLAQLDWDDALADAAAALEALRGRDETTGGVGAIGFCFGGGLAFNLVATTPVDALVSYYGSALPRLLHLADKVTVPTLHHFGT
ncbi:MAG TPA: dienelactone hydrolase family protein, partial [Actinomycetaceae bacterium]|nr:dienelactone hydrolase family protein [Actinomycetaceae bacterium]